ncbi:bifunctional 5,10-methylene-tetrahydrofolate dehydrogenase/5,10-methylene-tetrahydrofolate cyclohydrolase [candidate division WOR-1 bacterium RIFOXYB2_FULL_48_7]|uniref:Bifunctional protein FolD n=1 Tax=candidate division WOR-1 bacterium RIFOXYB2_FULL_48_7 TaxID=1802583 RepID=A0A1F4TVZ1_UNCSA|nr:MAG: bifunctional 5,10-methylene-tetrahydrofolate dehydrogenase/5,10-methylene-tetrahydrofolate cyclohydrolase [candidate division WOR-1 bacterium RIFOXYB2_FULL_48_7]
MGKIIDGKAIASGIKELVKQRADQITAKIGRPIKLVVVLVGDDPASQVYVRNKERACEDVGIASEVHRLPPSIKEEALVDLIERLNLDNSVDGILVQSPLPKGFDEAKVLNLIKYEKDVDGFHPYNLGKLLRGEEPLFVACTPAGVMEMLLSTGVEIKGKEAVVVGRSNIVGKPVALLLLQQHATVTICHSRTTNLAEVVKRGDIVVAAVGKAGIISGDMIKPGAVVIDVGTNKVNGKLVGDVDFAAASQKASYISPVPGGVGPMTIAMLMKNTVRAAELVAAKQPQ